MSQIIDEYRIECYTKFSWGYVYTIDEKRHEIWADNVDSLKRKVLAKGLPWDDAKVPEEKSVKIMGAYVEVDESPVQFWLPWCKSNYKRY